MEREKREWCNSSVEDVLKEFSAKREGFDIHEASARLQKYGKNDYSHKKRVTALDIFFRQFKSFVLYVLLAAVALSLVLGSHTEAIVIGSIVFFIIILSFLEEYKATKDMQALEDLSPKTAQVLRDGNKLNTNAKELVPGDIIILTRGNIVPADARIMATDAISLNESMLTGESNPVQKTMDTLKGEVPLSSMKNMVFAGTQVITGEATAIVTATGFSTEIGKISSLLSSIDQEQTPLQKKMERMTKQVTFIVFMFCILLFIVGFLKSGNWHAVLLVAMGTLVAGMPESIPTVVAVALSVGVKRMAKQNAIVKRLPAVETLGAVTVICSDKTGTLTQNKMVIEKIYTLDSEITVTGSGYSPEGLFLKEDLEVDPKKHKTVSKMLEIGILCNNANLTANKGGWKVDGESTEGALVVLARKAGMFKDEYHKEYKRVKEHPFDPVRKCMSTIHLNKNKPIVYTKGAPESVLDHCSYYLFDGKIMKMTHLERKKILKKNNEFAEKGLRVLALAYKEHKGKTFELKRVENELVFVGLVSIRDPPEPSAKSSIEMCHQAGIRVVMITGDNETTAKAIAKELGIFDEEKNTLLTGHDLDTLSESELKKIIDSVTIFARVTPEHKLKIVNMLQEIGNVVAMTGDGVNDAPALKKADIGIAMGSGTDVAKEASEIILLDDNFTTIVNAVKEGRTIYENIRKFIYYILVGSFSEVILMVLSLLMGTKPILTALMILFVNLVTGDLPSFGLATEKHSDTIMKQKPRSMKEGLLSEFMVLKVSQLVPIVVFGVLMLFMWEMNLSSGHVEKAQTMGFVALVFFELFHVLNCKSWDKSVFSKRFLQNRLLIGGILVSTVLTILAVETSIGNSLFATVALSWKEWLTIVCISSTILVVREIEKVAVNAEIKERERTQNPFVTRH